MTSPSWTSEATGHSNFSPKSASAPQFCNNLVECDSSLRRKKVEKERLSSVPRNVIFATLSPCPFSPEIECNVNVRLIFLLFINLFNLIYFRSSMIFSIAEFARLSAFCLLFGTALAQSSTYIIQPLGAFFAPRLPSGTSIYNFTKGEKSTAEPSSITPC